MLLIRNPDVYLICNSNNIGNSQPGVGIKRTMKGYKCARCAPYMISQQAELVYRDANQYKKDRFKLSGYTREKFTLS